MALSRFETALKSKYVTEVPMGGIKTIIFGPRQTGLGTKGLGGCSVALVVSSKAAVLAHIPARPEGMSPLDPEGGEPNVKLMMKKLQYRVDCLRTYFTQDSQCWVVCATMGTGNEPVLKKHHDIIYAYLLGLNLRVNGHTYTAGNKALLPDSGTVFVDASSLPPRVYIEERLAWGPGTWVVPRFLPSTQEADGAGVGPSSESSPFHSPNPGWIWSEDDLRHYTVDAGGQAHFVGPRYYREDLSGELYTSDPTGMEDPNGKGKAGPELHEIPTPKGFFFDTTIRQHYILTPSGNKRWVWWDNKTKQFFRCNLDDGKLWLKWSNAVERLYYTEGKTGVPKWDLEKMY
jgi:hypothetical protein